jgi:hypothetical protein
MSAIQYLGNGTGKVYIVATDGTTIVSSFTNNEDGARRLKAAGATVWSNAPRNAYNLITIGATVPTSGGNVDIDINGSAIMSTISYLNGDAVIDIANDIVDAINDYGTYSAYRSNRNIAIFTKTGGAAENGYAIVITNTGDATFTSTLTLDGGSDGNTLYDGVYGYRFFINADFDSTGCSCGTAASSTSLTNAIEISSDIIPQGLQGNIKRFEYSVNSAGTLIRTNNGMRQSAIEIITIDTSGSSTNLDSILFAGQVDGDILILEPNTAKTITVRSGQGNIVLSGTNSAVLGNKADKIALMWDVAGATYYELFRTGNAMPTVSVIRTALQPLISPTLYATRSLTVANNTTITLTANTDERFIDVSGAVSLSSGNYAISLSTTDAIKGDHFYIRYNGNVTVGSYSVTIGGKALTAHEALVGGLIIECWYNGTTWAVDILVSPDAGYRIATVDIYDAAVTVAKLAPRLNYEMITVPVSFETDEVGDMKIKIPFACTVSHVYVAVSKNIAATDDATVVCKDNSAASMGTITLTASSTIGTAFTLTPSSNNTFAADDVMTLTTAKTTKGGKGIATVKLTRS